MSGLNRKLGDAVTLGADVDSVAVKGLYVTRDGLVVRAEATGTRARLGQAAVRRLGRVSPGERLSRRLRERAASRAGRLPCSESTRVMKRCPSPMRSTSTAIDSTA